MTNPVSRQLRQKRQERNLSLEQVAEDTHIRLRFLKALEEGDFTQLPSHIQVRGFLRSYADYLGLDAVGLLASLQENFSSTAASSLQDPAAPDNDAGQDVGELIFHEIGLALQDRRELLGLSPEDVSQHTRIPEHYISYLEKGQMKNFPSPTQARGMLGNYVGFLDLDPERFLLRYADGLQAEFVARQPAADIHPVDEVPESRRLLLPLWLRNFITADILLGVIVFIGLASFIVWGIGRVADIRESQTPEPTAPSLANVLLPSSTAAPTPTSTPNAAETDVAVAEEDLAVSTEVDLVEGEPIEVFPESSTGGVQLNVVVRQRAWLRVVVDGEVDFEGRVIPGSAYQFSAQNKIEVLTGNGAAFQVLLNGQDLGSLGVFGEVVSLVFTPNGVSVPTATATPTLDPLLSPTETPSAIVPITATAAVPTAAPAP